jgi:hypothetical protein
MHRADILVMLLQRSPGNQIDDHPEYARDRDGHEVQGGENEIKRLHDASLF